MKNIVAALIIATAIGVHAYVVRTEPVEQPVSVEIVSENDDPYAPFEMPVPE